MRKIVLISLCFFVLLLSKAGFSEEVLRLATTTSTYETGLLDYILPTFEEKHDVKIHIISVGTGKAIKLGENGDVDIILVHARELEDRFLAQGYGVNRESVMYNDFVILGPVDDPAGISGLQDVTEAFKRIYNAKAVFVSRGDGSGTDKKEKDLWIKTGFTPEKEWYMETGQGMSATLRVTDERNAYVMVDRATYLFNKERIRLEKFVEGDKDLLNFYGAIAVNPDKYPHVKYEESLALIKWFTSSECQRMINEYKIKGEQLFYSTPRTI